MTRVLCADICIDNIRNDIFCFVHNTCMNLFLQKLKELMIIEYIQDMIYSPNQVYSIESSVTIIIIFDLRRSNFVNYEMKAPSF